MHNVTAEAIASTMALGAAMDLLREQTAGFDLIDHWQQGEFHHDVVLRLSAETPTAKGLVVVIATNCNGGIKEVLCFDSVPERYALWHWRCPNVQDFAGDLPPLVDHATTMHHFDPCELLRPDARSELRPEFREGEVGGGFRLKGACGTKA
jgi:hypothetical protein